MLLSDSDILHYIMEGSIGITGDYDIQCCSIDLGVEREHFLKPGDFKLVNTKNIIKLPNFLAGSIGGRSTYARKGLLVHATSSLINPGFSGRIVLELKNIGDHSIEIYDGEMISTLSFLKLLNPCTIPYNGRYQGQ